MESDPDPSLHMHWGGSVSLGDNFKVDWKCQGKASADMAYLDCQELSPNVGYRYCQQMFNNPTPPLRSCCGACPLPSSLQGIRGRVGSPPSCLHRSPTGDCCLLTATLGAVHGLCNWPSRQNKSWDAKVAANFFGGGIHMS